MSIYLILGDCMKNIVNGGIYNIDLEGTHKAEFVGTHPTLVIRSYKNKDMFYLIPLTTYTDERWKAYRKCFCCRITSTNSIARIDKVKIVHRFEITNRWIKNDELLVLEPNELETVYKRFTEYLTLSTTISLSDYKKYYNNYNTLFTTIFDHFEKYEFIEMINMDFREKECKCSFSYNICSNVTFDDVKVILYSILGKNNIIVKHDKQKKTIDFTIKDTYKKLLQLKEKYDIFNLTKGDVNKTSVVNL